MVDTQFKFIEWVKEQEDRVPALQVLGLAGGHRMPELGPYLGMI